MKKGILTLVCIALLVAVPGCHKNNEKNKPVKRQKTEKKSYRKKQNGNVVEETTTTRSEVREAMPTK